MSISDYYRPADYQINNIYRCDTCGNEIEQPSCYDVGNCSCGGSLIQCGESYPADSSEWDEQRDPDGEWRERRY